MNSVEELKINLLFPRAQSIPQQKTQEFGANLPPEERADLVLEVDRPPTTTRERQVYDDIQDLKTMLAEMSYSIYQMKLTENQLAELAEKILVQISDYISEVTIGRVSDIARDLLMKEAKRRVEAAFIQ